MICFSSFNFAEQVRGTLRYLHLHKWPYRHLPAGAKRRQGLWNGGGQGERNGSWNGNRGWGGETGVLRSSEVVMRYQLKWMER